MRWKGRQRPPRKYLACTQQRVLGVRVRWAFRLKDVLFTGSLKEYCPQRIRQLISVGYANIPMSADWGINQRLFHLVVPASPTLLGAGFFLCVFFSFFCCCYYSGFHDHKSPCVSEHVCSWQNAVLWVNPLAWCAPRHNDYIFCFYSTRRISVCFPSVVFFFLCRCEEQKLKEGGPLIHLKHPPTHTYISTYQQQ